MPPELQKLERLIAELPEDARRELLPSLIGMVEWFASVHRNPAQEGQWSYSINLSRAIVSRSA